MHSVVLLSLLFSVVYGHPPVIPSITFKDPNTPFTEPFLDFNEVGNAQNYLSCHSDLTTCCSSRQGFHYGRWVDPNGNELGFYDPNVAVYHTRREGSVGLHRRRDDFIPGKYCCDIETVKVHRASSEDQFNGERVCIELMNSSYPHTCEFMIILGTLMYDSTSTALIEAFT